MAEIQSQHRSSEEQYRERLWPGGFVLEPQMYESGLIRYLVRNAAGCVVFGDSGFGYTGTLEQVEKFLKAQNL